MSGLFRTFPATDLNPRNLLAAKRLGHDKARSPQLEAIVSAQTPVLLTSEGQSSDFVASPSRNLVAPPSAKDQLSEFGGANRPANCCSAASKARISGRRARSEKIRSASLLCKWASLLGKFPPFRPATKPATNSNERGRCGGTRTRSRRKHFVSAAFLVPA